MADTPTTEAQIAAAVAAANPAVLNQTDVTGTPIAQVVQRVIDDSTTPPGY